MWRVIVVCALLSVSIRASAAVVIKNLATGIDDVTGQKLANNTADADYLIANGGTGGRIGEIPLARNSPIGGGWLADGASNGSRWLVLNSGVGPEGISVGPGTYWFRTSVDLTGYDPSSAFLAAIRYATDNKLTAVLINGTPVYSQSLTSAEEFRGFTTLPIILGEGAFVTGLNSITFEVFNSGTGLDPMGLRIEGSVIAVPEPTILLMSISFVFVLLARRRIPLHVKPQSGHPF